MMKNYYGEVYNISELLKKVTDSYRLLIAGAAELNNIPEAKSSYVKDAVKRADKLGETIDHLITLLDKCGESYFQYCSVLGNYIMNKSTQKDILTEIDQELIYDNSSNLGQVFHTRVGIISPSTRPWNWHLQHPLTMFVEPSISGWKYLQH